MFLVSLNPEKIDEKKKRISAISEIDELKVIAQNHYLMGKFDDAIKIGKQIINLAKKAGFNSIIREQEKFISKIYQNLKEKDYKSFISEDFKDLKLKFEDLRKKEKIEEAHNIIEIFKLKYENIINLNPDSSIKELLEKEKEIWNIYSKQQNNIKSQLEPLEIQLESYLSTNNVILAKETLQKAKPLLSNLKDGELLERWGTLKVIYTELKSNYDVRKEIENSLNEISKLTDMYQFDQAKNILKSINHFIQDKGLQEYQKEITIKERSILDAEQKYNRLIKDIENLERLVENNIRTFLFNDAINNCQQIIKIARFIDKKKFVEKYTEYINEIEKRVDEYNKYEHLRNKLFVINKEALDALNGEDFTSALNKFKEIRDKIMNFETQV